MKRFKRIILTLLIILIAIQFIQPARNKSGQVTTADIEKTVVVPPKVLGLLKTSCYDCHSNNTGYPWYSGIQPGAWLMAYHIKAGKAMLNFSRFGELSNRKQQSKFQEIISQIKDDEMPIRSYTLIHKNAILTAEEKAILINWAESSKDSISLKN